MTRVEKVKQAQVLRAKGLSVWQIAQRMHVARSTASTWLADPDLSKQNARRERYRSRCIDCGAPTSGSDGFRLVRRRCSTCWAYDRHEQRYWTPERVIEALQGWAEELGRSPSAHMALRGEGPVTCSTVQREFGSWAAGLCAANLPPNRLGRPRKAVAA